jgi:hypothetical protein
VRLPFRKAPKVERNVPDEPLEKSAAPFRRNRTLANVSTINQADAESSARIQAHKLSLRRRKIGIVLGVVIILMIILLWLLSQLTTKIVISPNNTSTMSRLFEAKRYEKTVQDYMRLHPLARLRFILNPTDFNQYISSQLPEVKQIVQLGRGQIGETKFQISVRVPVAVWQTTNKYYYVDGDGIAFKLNYFQKPTVTIIDDSEIVPDSNKTVVGSRFLSFVGRVVALSEKKGLIVTEALIPSGTTRQLEIMIKDQQPVIRLSIDRGAREQVEDMARSLAYLTSHGKSPEYIDVRVSNKAFYK